VTTRPSGDSSTASLASPPPGGCAADLVEHPGTSRAGDGVRARSPVDLGGAAGTVLALALALAEALFIVGDSDDFLLRQREG